MKTRLTKILAGLAALVALALGGAAIAGATQGGSDEPEQTLKGADADRASAAALKATGGGTVNEVERDSEKGATFEVEVRKRTAPPSTSVSTARSRWSPSTATASPSNARA